MTFLRFLWRTLLYLSFVIVVVTVALFFVSNYLGYAVRPTLQTIDEVSFTRPPLQPVASDSVYFSLYPSAIPDTTTIRNIVLILGDGMGIAQLTTVLDLAAGDGYVSVLAQMPVTGLVRTYSANSLVTDSGAGATAFSTGYKTVNRRIAKTPTGESARTLLEQMRDQGKATGIITTSYLVDASPAAFAAHVDHRDETETIAAQMLAADIDLLLGGDGDTFPESLLSEAERQGYAVVRTAEALAALPDSGRVLGLWDGRKAFEAYGPPLPGLVQRALAQLRRDPDGFFLFIEQEQTDGGAHANRFDFVQTGVLELDEALRVVLNFAAADGHTLVLVVADHDTGGVGVVDGYFSAAEAEVRWSGFSHTNHWTPLFAAGPGADAFTGVLENTDVPRRIATLMAWTDFPALLPETVP